MEESFGGNSKIQKLENKVTEDIPKAPEGDTKVREMEELTDKYKLGKFGRINKYPGEFWFLQCKICRGPLLGHKVKEEACEDDELDVHLVDEIEYKIMKMLYFKEMLASIDKRPIAVKCSLCEELFSSRLANIGASCRLASPYGKLAASPT